MGNIEKMYGMIDRLIDKIYSDNGGYTDPHKSKAILLDIQRALDMAQSDIQLTIDAIRHEEGV